MDGGMDGGMEGWRKRWIQIVKREMREREVRKENTRNSIP